jgi:hypothetical protein
MIQSLGHARLPAAALAAAPAALSPAASALALRPVLGKLLPLVPFSHVRASSANVAPPLLEHLHRRLKPAISAAMAGTCGGFMWYR